MHKTTALRTMMLVAGGLTAAVAVPGVAAARCCGAFRAPHGASDYPETANRETAEQREARLARAQARREARLAARAERQRAQAALAANERTPGGRP